MRNFIKIIFGSCLGVILALVVLGFVLSFYTASLITAGSGSASITSNSVLKISFDQPIPQKTNNTEEMMYNLSDDKFLGLYETIESIQSAKSDRRIKGIYLHLSSGSMGNAKADDIREALEDFKESGKFIYAYSGNYGYSQGAYYLASVADKVFLHPLGAVDLHGFGTTIPFFKDMLDKLGVKMQTFYAGKFKGATEPYRRNDLSEENRLQIKSYMSEMYENFVEDIAASRGLSTSQVKSMASNLDGRYAALAHEKGLVDELVYEDQVFAEIRSSLDMDKDDKIPFITLADYSNKRDKDNNLTAGDKIAVLYAEGEIRAGQETYGMITDQHYVDVIRKIREDDKVRALVLRVNSPGGDGFVSDEIWRELELVQEAGVPVIASMADVAASGGYYISCGADRILAEPNTITGSIGVFGIIPNASELLNDKLGVHVDTVKTAEYATGIVSPFYPTGDREAALVQNEVDRFYESFLARVADGRSMTRDQVHEVAQGRVWTGEQALERGLVDEMGDIHDAIALAAEMANISDYRLTEYPRIKDPLQKLIEDLSSQSLESKIEDKMLAKFFPELHKTSETLRYMIECKRPQARLPFDLSILN